MSDTSSRTIAAEPTPRGSRIPVTVLTLGFVSLALFIASNRVHERWIQRDSALVGAIERIQLALTTAHLWLEEYVAGDDVDVAEILTSLTRSHELIEAMLEGSDVSESSVRIRPLVEHGLRVRATRVQQGITQFGDLSDRRLRGFVNGEVVGTGSAIDVEYDRVFRALLIETRELETLMEARQSNNHRRATLLFRAIVVAWTIIFGLATVLLWTRERRRLRTETELRESRAQLYQSQKMEAIGRLAGGMAHDINNYLGAIRAQSELVMMKAPPGGSVRRKMEAIVSVVTKISSLIERLLAFSRQEPIIPEVVSINRVIREGVGSMVRRLVGEDIRLDVRLEPRLWNVKIDPSQIEQVIVNLVVNARDAMPCGGAIGIETSNGQIDANAAALHGLKVAGDYVLLSVTDTGEGVEDEIRDKIFDPFFTTKGLSKSSGLGLSTVHGIVVQNGGAVDLQSVAGKGANFRIFLPRSRRPECTGRPVPEVVERVEFDGKILLVEDNDELRESTCAMIEALGYQVIATNSAEQALEMFDESAEQLELVITDVVMPGLSGREMIDRIRLKRSDLKVLYVSGYTDDIILRHGISRSDAAFLKKPYSADALVNKIRELVEPTA